LYTVTLTVASLIAKEVDLFLEPFPFSCWRGLECKATAGRTNLPTAARKAAPDG
jgi:hypothetical protein